MQMPRRLWPFCTALTLATSLFLAPVRAEEAAGWDKVLNEARGETVYFNAWGGSEPINTYLAWAGERLKAEFGVTLTQVKLDDTANGVAKIVAEKAAGKTTGGSVDLIWINGENFAALQSQDLLSEGFATNLPNWRYVDP
ncbi:MAG: ABC transporter substrate-binding protein, partial [Hyphomicrobiales bacterium]